MFEKLTLYIRGLRIRQLRKQIGYLKDMLLAQCPKSDVAVTVRRFLADREALLARLVASMPQEG